jgi:UDP:flavonoid glycosyltransferase YjiC (YdhE family)
VQVRVLFVSTPGIGHVFPMVPLAWAVRAAGHEVRVATTGPARAVARAGLPVVDVAPEVDFRALQAKFMRENPELVRQMQRGDLRDIAAAAGRMSAVLVDGVLAAAQGWQPNVIVQSPIQAAGLLAGAKLGIPVVDHGFGLARVEGLSALAGRRLVDDELPRPQVIDVAPPSMLDDPPHGWSMRYVPFNGGAVLPEWLATPPERDRIAVTLGTTAPTREGLDPLHHVIDVAKRVDADFVLAVEKEHDLGPLPHNVKPAGWIPLNALLPTCRAVIHHGGAGTTLTALAHGVPQLVLPTGSDRFINASAVHRRGAGLVAAPEETDAELIDRVVRDDAIRAAAEQVRQEIDAMPAPARIAPRLVELAS